MNEVEKPMTADDIDLSRVGKIIHQRISEMLHKHKIVWNVHLGDINIADHAIYPKVSAKPLKLAPDLSGPIAREPEAIELKKKPEAGIMETIVSDRATHDLFDPKKDSQSRFCVGFRKLNEMIQKHSFPLPRVEDCVSSLGQGKMVSTFEAYSGYRRINIRKKDRPKTAVATHYGSYQYI